MKNLNLSKSEQVVESHFIKKIRSCDIESDEYIQALESLEDLYGRISERLEC